MGNSWQSPVSGEPSLGTPHEHVYAIYSGSYTTASSPYTIDLSAQVPVGTKAVAIYLNGYGTAADCQILVRNTAETKTYAMMVANPLGYRNLECIVALDSSRTFKVVVTTNTWSFVTFAMTHYWI